MAGQDNMETTDEAMGPRAECESNLNRLREVTRIHQSIGELSRGTGANDPEWMYRLSKIWLHARAIDGWGVDDIDVAHVMAPELRAAYLQMDAVWKCIPPEYKRRHGLDAIDGDYWANEARDGKLATYDHPTPFNLIIGPTALGDFHSGNPDKTYIQLAIWLGSLGLGYGSALAYLAQVLGVGGDVVTRLAAAMMQGLDEPVSIERMSSFPGHGEQLGDS